MGHIHIERNKLARAHPESNASPTLVPQIDTTFAFLSNIVSNFMYDRVRDFSDQVLNIPRQTEHTETIWVFVGTTLIQ